MPIPLIGQKPQLPPTTMNGGFHEGQVWLQFAPVGLMSIEKAEEIIAGLQRAVDVAKAQRAAVRAVIDSNGASE